MAMNLRRFQIHLVMLIAFAAPGLCWSGGGGAGAKVASFELQDQFGTNHTCSFPSLTPRLIVLADRKGYPEIEGWVQPTHERFGSGLAIQGVADVTGVPGPLRGFVRQKFRSKVPYAVMLDWEGNVLRQFQPQKAVANIYLLNAEGRVLVALHGKATPAGLAELHEAISAVLRDEKRPAKSDASR